MNFQEGSFVKLKREQIPGVILSIKFDNIIIFWLKLGYTTAWDFGEMQLYIEKR